jgi:hypothetical protein
MIKIRNTPSCGGEVKPSAPCRKILLHVKIPAEYDRDTTSAKFTDILHQLQALLLDVSAATGEHWWMN